MASVDDHPYPTCDGEPLPEGEVLAADTLRSGPGSLEQVVERYEYRRRGCVYVLTVYQEWPLGVADVEIVYDLDWRPLRAWKRMTLPGADELIDTRIYELRNRPATMSWRGEEGLKHFFFREGQPSAVVAPGRGMVSAIIQANFDLEPGDSARGSWLDIREMVERVDEVALRRDPDRDVPGLGRVRVYTIFGRESVFTDEEGWVVGDLGGLRRDAVLDTPAPPSMAKETSEPPDPRAPL